MTDKKGQRSADNSADPKRKDYEVGYGRPPKETRFKPGHPGYRGSRKTPTPSFDKALVAALRRTVTIKRNGVTTKIPVYQAIAERMLADAMAGKPRMLELTLTEMRRLHSDSGADDKQQLAEDEQIVAQFAASIRERNEDR